MKAEEIRIVNWVIHPLYGKEQVRIMRYDGAVYSPLSITPELLLKNGWRKQTELTYYKKLDKIRLGWQEGGVLIVGWTEWPKKIESVHQLQNILADLGYEEQANNFKI